MRSRPPDRKNGEAPLATNEKGLSSKSARAANIVSDQKTSKRKLPLYDNRHELAARILDPRERAEFLALLAEGDRLIIHARETRRLAWLIFALHEGAP
jgi:hypothetical protein